MPVGAGLAINLVAEQLSDCETRPYKRPHMSYKPFKSVLLNVSRVFHRAFSARLRLLQRLIHRSLTRER